MQKSGTIKSIVAAGGYQSQGGYIYTFQMTIQTAEGEMIAGEIGSKSEEYPLAVEQPIIVTVTQTDRGAKLKKVNPQYANQAPAPAAGNNPLPGVIPYGYSPEQHKVVGMILTNILNGTSHAATAVMVKENKEERDAMRWNAEWACGMHEGE